MRFFLLFIFVTLLVACTRHQETSKATFHSLSYLNNLKDTTRLGVLKVKYDSLKPPLLVFDESFDSPWRFAVGNSNEGLITPYSKFDGEPVQLPHQISVANHPLWYSANLVIDKPGYLNVKADDGAQVYINKKFVNQVAPNFFAIDTIGKALITIRVLNNAMNGGLQQVKFIAKEHFLSYQLLIKDYECKKQLVLKTLLKFEVNEYILDLASKILARDDNASMNLLKSEFRNYPYFIGPFLMMSDGKLIIVLVTDSKEKITLKWGAAPNALTNQQTQKGPIGRFELERLDNNRNYYYKIISSNTSTGIIQFKTERLGPFSFNVWADSQSGWDAFEQTMHLINQGDDAFGIAIGDLVSDGSDAEHWKRFISLLSSSASTRPYYLIPGNHDYDGFYDDLYPLNYYRYTGNVSNYQSWTYGNATFIALDPNENFPIGINPGDDQYEWLYAQLESDAWKKATWRFILLHQPPFSQGWKGYHGDKVIRDLLEPIIESAGIDFIVSGHTHDYERLTKTYGKQKVTFLIVGGAGGNLEGEGQSIEPKMDKVIKHHHLGRFSIDGNKILFRAIGHNFAILDSIQFLK